MGVVNYYVVPYDDRGDTTLSIKHSDWTKGGVRQRRAVMRPSLDIHLLSYLYLTLILFSSFSALSSSPSSCELQAQFNLNRIYKEGDFVLGGLFYITLYPVFPELSFNSKPQDPTCYG